jgi:multidrug efflux pump subunit AcrA (membrane-fusion protein)
VGQVVKKGDLLFEFGPKSAELSLALAQSHLKQAEAQLRLAETNLKNKQTLRTRKVASEMQFLDAKAQRDIAAAKVDEVRANVELGQISLQQMKLYAPITDIISRAFIREGQRGARSKPARHHCPARSHPRSQASCCCRKFPAQRQGRRSAQNAGADRRAAGIQACPAPC